MQALTGARVAVPFTGNCRPRLARRRQRSVLRAVTESNESKGASTTTSPGFKYDGAMQRWVRDDRYAGKSMTTITPLSGPAFTVWPVMWTFLNENGLTQVDAEEAQQLVTSQGAIIVDVRLAADYAAEHIEGSISLPLFRETAGKGKWDNVKKFVMGSLAMKATERNPDFINDFERALGADKNKPIIVTCSIGGTLDTIVRVASTGKTAKDPDRSFGRETRSLKACYELMMAGYTNVYHLKGGLAQWRFEGHPTDSSD